MLKCLKEDCNGCNVCVASCPVNAIELECSEDGFWYPVIRDTDCIHCGLCDLMCPIQNKVNDNVLVKTYAAYSKDESTLRNSSSGGMFFEISKQFIENGGVVVGAAYDYDLNEVRHRIVYDVNKLFCLMGSKYVQSFISCDIYEEIKKLLSEKRSVLFSGTPCQVAAMKNYCSNNNMLFTIDIVCHGVPSPKAWKAYLLSMKNNPSDVLERVSFRSKENGWTKFEMALDFSDYNYSKWFNEDLWGKSFIHNVYLRESCYQCHFKDSNRCGDITLGDFWGKGIEYNPTDKGCSLVIINNMKGKELFDEIQENIISIESSFQIALDGNYALYRSSERYPYRKLAFKLLNREVGFAETINKLFAQSAFKKLLKKIYKKLIGVNK